MENVIKQIRMIIFRVDEENDTQTSRLIRDRKFSSRRTRSSKGDSWKGHNRSRTQLSRDTSREYDKTEGDEFRTAVAAAAFVVSTMENKKHEIKQDRRSNSTEPNKNLSEILDVPPRQENNENLTGGVNRPTPTVVKTEDNEKVSKITDLVGSISKTPSFVANEQLDEKARKKEPETRPGEADIWEKTEMEKIKERFVKLKTKIFEWEKKKKLKTKNKLIRKEGKLEWKRARALQDYKKKIETIERISKLSISQNDKNRKKEEIKVKEKANMIRSKGKISKPVFLCC